MKKINAFWQMNKIKILSQKIISKIWLFSKNRFIKFRDGMPHYWLRAFGACVMCIYMLYLLKCFTTIPIKDYYFDIYSTSRDSVVPNITLTVGNRNILNTYSDDFSPTGDSCTINYDLYHYVQTWRWIYSDNKVMSIIMDSIYCKSKQDHRYSTLLCTYNPALHKNYLYRDTLSTYIYMNAYLNYLSSVPIGYSDLVSTKKRPFLWYVHKKDTIIESEQMGIYTKMAFGLFPRYFDIDVLCDSVSYKQLSRNHSYLNQNHLFVINDRNHYVKKMSGYQYASPGFAQNSFDIPYNPIGVYTFSKKLLYILQKEDISQSYYHFSVHAKGIEAYKITLQTRGGAVIHNNPSDELKVLSLHDTQITKRKPELVYCTNPHATEVRNKKYTDTDLFVTFPENASIQYIRLFFVTLFIGWLILSISRNLGKGFKKAFNKLKN